MPCVAPETSAGQHIYPTNVPANPDRTYKHDGWHGWGHWLGTGNQLSKDFLPFDNALLVARSLRLINQKEWRAWCRTGARPANLPARPDEVYVHDGWLGWEHWLRHTNPDTAPAASWPHSKRAADSGTCNP